MLTLIYQRLIFISPHILLVLPKKRRCSCSCCFFYCPKLYTYSSFPWAVVVTTTWNPFWLVFYVDPRNRYKKANLVEKPNLILSAKCFCFPVSSFIPSSFLCSCYPKLLVILRAHSCLFEVGVEKSQHWIGVALSVGLRRLHAEASTES